MFVCARVHHACPFRSTACVRVHIICTHSPAHRHRTLVANVGLPALTCPHTCTHAHLDTDPPPARIIRPAPTRTSLYTHTQNGAHRRSRAVQPRPSNKSHTQMQCSLGGVDANIGRNWMESGQKSDHKLSADTQLMLRNRPIHPHHPRKSCGPRSK